MKRATSQVDGLTRVELFGLDFVDETSIERVADLVLGSTPAEVEGHPVIVTPNTDLLLQVVHTPDAGIREFFAKAWCVLPDGQPIVWASRLLGAPLRFRLTGSDLFAHLWPRLVQQATPVFVLAPNAAVASGLQDSNAAAATLVAPILDVESRTDLVALAAQCVAEITAAAAQVVILSLGHPKDVMIADEILQQLDATSMALPFILCLGGSAEMYLGIRKRAPQWVQRCSAEWLYRFAQEPRRLFTRYFIRDAGFIPLVWREYQAKRRADDALNRGRVTNHTGAADASATDMVRPVVSVVMPIGGIDAFLPEQLDALAEQTFDGPWELVLSMNQPGTTLDPIVNGYRLHPTATRRVVDSSSERSAAHARNAGAAAATADLLAFCDADDIVEPTWLAALVEALDDYEVVGGYLDERRLSPPGQDRWRPPATPDELPSYLGHRYPVSANMAARRASFTTVDGFVEGLTRCEDIAFGWALADAGIELGYAPEAVVHYRHRPGLWTMVRQHHYYGIGMTEVIERQGLPGGDAPSGLLAANKQRVTQRSVIHILRRGAIASGRLRGLVQERLTRRNGSEHPR